MIWKVVKSTGSKFNVDNCIPSRTDEICLFHEQLIIFQMKLAFAEHKKLLSFFHAVFQSGRGEDTYVEDVNNILGQLEGKSTTNFSISQLFILVLFYLLSTAIYKTQAEKTHILWTYNEMFPRTHFIVFP